MNKEYITISDINRIIKFTIESNSVLKNVYIKGEIRNLKFQDENSKINAVMFNYKSVLKFIPKDGDSVLVHGRVSVYEATGSYQIYVDSMDMDGTGNLYILFEELKKKLSSEGLFDQSHKKKIKRIPRKIGVITAPTGAAIKDIISTINKRYPLVTIYVFPTLVQGEFASKNIVRMIEYANTFDDIDTIILGRGGGAIEDLWPFNEEIVARAIYNSRIPIISGVGHEIDFTISDFVADFRAPTPTGAAVAATPDLSEIKRYFSNTFDKINNSINNRMYSYRELINKYKSNYLLNNPMRLYEMKEQKLDILYDKCNNAIYNILNNYKNNTKHIDTLKIKLDLLNPENILDKGYSIVYKDNKIIKDIKDINISDNINIVVKTGKINANVKGVSNNE